MSGSLYITTFTRPFSELTYNLSLVSPVEETALAFADIRPKFTQPDLLPWHPALHITKWMGHWNYRLRFLSDASLCSIVQTPRVTCVWRHRGHNFLHSVHQKCYSSIGLESPLPASKERRRRSWCTDLNLKGFAVVPEVSLVNCASTSPLSIHNMTAPGECIQSEALNVDTLKWIDALTLESVELFQPYVLLVDSWDIFAGNIMSPLEEKTGEQFWVALVAISNSCLMCLFVLCFLPRFTFLFMWVDQHICHASIV